jgi:uncharacterized protein
MGRKMGAVVLRREDDGQVLCENCVLADSIWRRMRGLLGRSSLDAGDGIVLRPAWSIHTFFMRFPIDVLFVDADQVVAKVVGDLKPWHTASCRGARDVVELSAGETTRLGIQAGDRLAWAAQRQHRPDVAAQSANGVPLSGDGRRRERTRVLVGTGDDHFLRLARFLLTRHDFDVEATRRVSKTVDMVDRREPDVVVIDATESLGEAARTVAAIEALHPGVRVVVVYDGEPPRWTTGLKVTEKWTALETLPDDINNLVAERAWT